MILWAFYFIFISFTFNTYRIPIFCSFLIFQIERRIILALSIKIQNSSKVANLITINSSAFHSFFVLKTFSFVRRNCLIYAFHLKSAGERSQKMLNYVILLKVLLVIADKSKSDEKYRWGKSNKNVHSINTVFYNFHFSHIGSEILGKA